MVPFTSFRVTQAVIDAPSASGGTVAPGERVASGARLTSPRSNFKDADGAEAVRHQDLRKHGIDFSGAVRIFDGPVLEREDRRRDYGELRLVALGEVEGVLLAVVYTPRGSVFRIIPARKAHRYEKAAYRQVQSPEAQGPHGLGAGSRPD